MPYRITLDNYTPSARLADAGVWTQVRYEYAAARQGPWTAILTEALSPADTDPLVPLTRDLDVVVPDEGYPGWLRVVFLDAGGNQEPTDPVYVGSAIRPTVLEVANLMPDRTTLDGGGEAGTFTSATEPTATQVDALIDLVLDSVDPQVIADADAETQRRARAIIALNAAILVETSYFGNQSDANESRITVWERLIGRYSGTLTTGSAAAGGTAGPVHLKVGSVIDGVVTVSELL